MQTQFNIPLPAIGIDRVNGRQWYIDEADDAHMKQEGFVAMHEAIVGKVAYYGQKDSLPTLHYRKTARAFYGKQGFTQAACMPNFYRNGDDKHVYCRLL